MTESSVRITGKATFKPQRLLLFLQIRESDELMYLALSSSSARLLKPMTRLLQLLIGKIILFRKQSYKVFFLPYLRSPTCCANSRAAPCFSLRHLKKFIRAQQQGIKGLDRGHLQGRDIKSQGKQFDTDDILYSTHVQCTN